MPANNLFGDYLKALRKDRIPVITQARLGEMVGKSGMAINLIERGKNDPPKGELLEAIVVALCRNEEEKNKLRDLASIARGTIPNDLLTYFTKSEALRNAIRRARDQNLPDSEWDKLIR